MSDHEMERSLISAYCDGELSGAELAQVENLLETSASARAELQSYRSLSTLLQEGGRPKIQANLAASVMQAIQQQGAATAATTIMPASANPDSGFKKSRSHNRTWALATTSAACLAFAVWLGVNQAGKREVAKNDLVTKSTDTTLVAANDSNKTITTKSTSAESVTEKPKTVQVAKVDSVKPVQTTVAQADLKSNPVNSATKPLEANQLPLKLISDLKNSNVGQMQRFVRQNKDGVTVFHLMVVDIKPGFESLEMMLSSQKISVNGKPVNERGDVVAVYVETDQVKMEGLVKQIKEEHQKFLALGLQHAATPMEVAALVGKKMSDSTQAVPVDANELKSVGVAPLKQEEIALAQTRGASKTGGQSLANAGGRGDPKASQSSLMKLLIVVEKASPESLLNPNNGQKN